MTPDEIAKLNAFKQAQNKAPVLSEGTTYNPIEHPQAQNYANQQAVNAARQSVPIGIEAHPNNGNLQGNLANGNALQNEADYQKMNPYVSGGSKGNPTVFQRTGSLNQQNSGGDFTVGQTLGGVAPNPGYTTIFNGSPPENSPEPKKIPIGDVKKPGDKVEVQDSKGNVTPLKDTDKIVVREKPQVNLFDFLEAAAAGGGKNPNKRTALNERMAQYYNKLDEDQKASLQQQYAERMAEINQKNEIQRINLEGWWRNKLNPMMNQQVPGAVKANIAAQDVVGGGK